MVWYEVSLYETADLQSELEVNQLLLQEEMLRLRRQPEGDVRGPENSFRTIIDVHTGEISVSNYPRTFSHIGISVPDIEGLVEKIVAHGGKQRMPIREYYPGEKPYKMVYVEDPFGLIFEVYSHSYELTYSQGAY